ncbi:hypothetical protein CS542_02500 [Pedobacter sp. IW39]|nr:hypothetical protein CS542_02500 [Pedobacter sp. IW39]
MDHGTGDPCFVIDEDVKQLKICVSDADCCHFNYPGLIEWSQVKWQKQFMLRQQAEILAAQQEKCNSATR